MALNAPEGKDPSSVGRKPRVRFLQRIGWVTLLSVPVTYAVTGTSGIEVGVKLTLGLALVGLGFLVGERPSLGDAFARRRRGLWAIGGGSVAILIVVLAIANVFVLQNPIEWDTTRESLHTLSQESIQIVRSIERPVLVRAFYERNEPDRAVAERQLARYRAASDRVTVEVIAPSERPDLVETLQLESDGPRLRISSDLRTSVLDSLAEVDLTTAIRRVAQPEGMMVHVLEGHGELALDDADSKGGYGKFYSALQDEGYVVAPFTMMDPTGSLAIDGQTMRRAPLPQGSPPSLSLADGRPIEPPVLELPTHIKTLLILSPRGQFLPEERLALAAFLDRGGRLLLIHDPMIPEGLDEVLRPYGIRFRDDLVVDPSPRGQFLGQGPAALLLRPVEPLHPINEALHGPVVMPTVRSVELLAAKAFGDSPEAARADRPTGVETRPLLATTPSAWGETDYRTAEAMLDGDDPEGPVFTAASARRRRYTVKVEVETRLVVVGDSDWLNNTNFDIQANRDFALNTIAWLSERETDIIVRPSRRDANRLLITASHLSMIQLVTIDILPLLLVTVGMWVTSSRKAR